MLYEGGIRVPMVARWTGRIPAGLTSAHASAFEDYMPTFAELAGIRRPADADGVSLVVVTVVLALFTIVFAELVPKTLALANSERFALTLSVPLVLLGRILTPVVALLTSIAMASLGA